MVDHSLFFAQSREMLAVVDHEHRLVTVNPAWAASLGDADASLLAQVHDDDRQRVTDELAAILPGARARVDARVRGRAGEYHPLELDCVRAAEPGGELHVNAHASPSSTIAELADLKRRLAAIFSTMQDEVYMTDERGIIDGLARAPEGVPASAVIGTVMLDWSAPDERAAMEARYREVRDERKLVVYDTTARYPDGRIQYMSSRMGPILDGERPIGTVLITRNVTNERLAEIAKQRAEQQVREYTVALERSNSELERFASVASHDLQEPLRKIQAFSSRLHDRFTADLPETARDYLSRVRDAAKRMQDLINDLLMFSRLSTAKQAFVPTNLTTIARNVLSDLEVRIEEVGGAVNVGTLPTIDADPLHMRQLFQNLIGNALKFTRPGTPPVVNVSATVEPPSAGSLSPRVQIRFADNGIGIEPRFHERIFGLFERLHGRGQYAGTGIGLSVCRKIVEQHHGNIEVTSVPGQGTTFTIVLPLRQLERSPAP